MARNVYFLISHYSNLRMNAINLCTDAIHMLGCKGIQYMI